MYEAVWKTAPIAMREKKEDREFLSEQIGAEFSFKIVARNL
jgi:hypothetical protein